jgi:hypothetical protein
MNELYTHSLSLSHTHSLSYSPTLLSLTSHSLYPQASPLAHLFIGSLTFGVTRPLRFPCITQRLGFLLAAPGDSTVGEAAAATLSARVEEAEAGRRWVCPFSSTSHTSGALFSIPLYSKKFLPRSSSTPAHTPVLTSCPLQTDPRPWKRARRPARQASQPWRLDLSEHGVGL